MCYGLTGAAIYTAPMGMHANGMVKKTQNKDNQLWSILLLLIITASAGTVHHPMIIQSS